MLITLHLSAKPLAIFPDATVTITVLSKTGQFILK